MKIDNRFGSMWDELPGRRERKVPETRGEAQDLYVAAQSSLNTSVMKTWDAHNDMMRKAAELRKVQARKKLMEQQDIEHREEQREFLEMSSATINKQKIFHAKEK